jgi:three-Cys-motif partner protein
LVRQRFGSAHTEEKLGKLEEYLKVYSTALKHQKFRLIYFDAFAGTGDIQVAAESSLLNEVASIARSLSARHTELYGGARRLTDTSS